jgi:hypothetical protein
MASRNYEPRRRHSHKQKKPADRGFSYTNISHATCTDCGKQIYVTRKEAKHAADVLHPGATMRVYTCPLSAMNPPPWHFTKMGALRTESWKNYEAELSQNKRRD